jgi:hypothetical protein
MAYADLLDDEGINSQFLAILKPRMRHTSFTLYAGSVYYASFGWSVFGVSVNGSALSEGASASLSAGEWYYSASEDRLYIRKSDSSAPNASTDFIVSTFEIYVGTFDAHWYRVPTDSSTATVYYEPLILRSPTLDQSSTNLLFGFLPVKTTSLVISNATQYLQEILHSGSFSRAEVRVYHWLGDLDTDNMKLVLRGTCQNVAYQDSEVQISIFDRLDILAQEYRQPSGSDSFFDTTTFSALDPNFKGRPIRSVYGVVDGFQPVNIDFDSSSPTTSENRDWVCISGQSDLGSITTTVPASPASSATRTYLTSAAGFQVGDTVWLDRAVGTDEYMIVADVSYASNYIEHAALSGGAMASADSVKRSFVGRVNILQNNVTYTALYGRDYTEATFSGNTSGFSFTTSMEANLGISTLTTQDQVWARVYGKTNANTLSGSPFGSDDSETGVLSQGVVILYELLKTYLSIPESEMNLSSFTSLQSSCTDRVGFSIPQTATNAFPSFREILSSLLQTLLVKLYVDNSDDWKISRVGPLGAVTKTIEDDEILRKSVQVNLDYNDTISDVIVEYAFREIADKTFATQTGEVKTVSKHSSLAEYLHLLKKQKTIRSLHYKESEATTYAQRLAYVLGERRGMMSLRTKNRFFDSLLQDVIQVSRTRLLGYTFDEDTERTRSHAVVEVRRSLNQVSLLLDEQKGIEDNSASW